MFRKKVGFQDLPLQVRHLITPCTWLENKDIEYSAQTAAVSRGVSTYVFFTKWAKILSLFYLSKSIAECLYTQRDNTWNRLPFTTSVDNAIDVPFQTFYPGHCRAHPILCTVDITLGQIRSSGRNCGISPPIRHKPAIHILRKQYCYDICVFDLTLP